jgi:hypothetical protein
MLDLQRLPLADPLADSLGRLFGQYPALTYVNCTNNVRMPLVTAHFAAKPVPGRAVVRVGVAAVWVGTVQRSIRRRSELYPAASLVLFVFQEFRKHAPSLVEDAPAEATENMHGEVTMCKIEHLQNLTTYVAEDQLDLTYRKRRRADWLAHGSSGRGGPDCAASRKLGRKNNAAQTPFRLALRQERCESDTRVERACICATTSSRMTSRIRARSRNISATVCGRHSGARSRHGVAKCGDLEPFRRGQLLSVCHPVWEGHYFSRSWRRP